jgi:DNA-directed RNA polymerase subunit RPC12/RpoP
MNMVDAGVGRIREVPYLKDESKNGITGEEEMDKLTNLRCPQCGTSFPVELHKMRSNMPASCPSCGSQCRASEDQAIRAHRLLERLEYRKRIVSPQFGAASFL